MLGRDPWYVLRCCIVSAALLLVGCNSGSAPTISGSPATASSSPATGVSASATTSAESRPAYNTGDGFFVLNGKLYDANGNPFRIRGVNRVHWDSNSEAGIAKSGANTVRWDIDFTRPASTNIQELQNQSIQNNEVPIVGNWDGTCNSDPTVLQSIVSTWVAQAPQWTTLNRYLIVNIANEWGPADSTVWRDSYISAIAQLRAAGYTGPLLIDSGGCGQDEADLIQYSQAVFDSDPERNVMFAEHLYGNVNPDSAQIVSVEKGNPTVITLASNAPCHPFSYNEQCYTEGSDDWNGMTSFYISGAQGMTQLNGVQPATANNLGGSPGSWTITLSVDSTNWGTYTGGGTIVDNSGNPALRVARLAALSKTTGAAYIIGEFGPGNDIGPSPTMATPAQIITAAEANGIGWLAWAWDDNDLANCMSDNNWFSMTYNCGIYTQPSDLTNYGQEVVLNPNYGLTALAKPASIF